jgi:hypothetical protein
MLVPALPKQGPVLWKDRAAIVPPNGQTVIIGAGKNAPTALHKEANNTCAVKTLGTVVDWR